MKAIASHWVWVLAGLLISIFLFVSFFNLSQRFKEQYYQSIIIDDVSRINQKIGMLCNSPEGTKVAVDIELPYNSKGFYMGLKNLFCGEGVSAYCENTACDFYMNNLILSKDYLIKLHSFSGKEKLHYRIILEKKDGYVSGNWEYVGDKDGS